MAEQQQYQVVILKRASIRFDAVVLPSLLDNFTLERAIEIEGNLKNTVDKLSVFPSKGTLEKELEDFPKEFRFILFKETRNLELKIIYHINEEIKRVYITDFFPVKMNDKSIKYRS